MADPRDSEKVLILGASGQVGSALIRLLGTRAIGLDQSEIDLEKPDTIFRALEAYHPAALINAAAYTAVDLAEKEEHRATLINGESPGVLAAWCRERKIPLIHYSTDYVFPGTGNRPWKESDPTSPLNAYGRSKLAGEQAIATAGGDWLLFRCSWIYDENGKNFLKTMLRLGAERERLSIVNDQHGAPTYAPHIAQATLTALAKARSAMRFPTGIYHLCNRGETTWYYFARAIFEEARSRGTSLRVKTVDPIASSDYPAPAKRPVNSRLDLSKLKEVFGIELPHWEGALTECMEKVG